MEPERLPIAIIIIAIGVIFIILSNSIAWRIADVLIQPSCSSIGANQQASQSIGINVQLCHQSELNILTLVIGIALIVFAISLFHPNAEQVKGLIFWIAIILLGIYLFSGFHVTLSGDNLQPYSTTITNPYRIECYSNYSAQSSIDYCPPCPIEYTLSVYCGGDRLVTCTCTPK